MTNPRHTTSGPWGPAMPERSLRPPTPFRGVLHLSCCARALRDYADRWHGTVEGVATPTDYGTGIEYDAICQCGVSVGEDGCTERQQLLADADAIEQGRDFKDVAEEGTDV